MNNVPAPTVRSRSLSVFLAGCLGFVTIATALVAEDYHPEIAPASDEGKLAIQGFKVPDGVEVELFAAEPMLANPVAFCIDEQGRVYVAETFRQSKGVEDNRGHMDWLERDLALTTVEERRKMFEDFLGEEVASYSEEHDRVRLLIDEDADGKADKATVFADGFNDVVEGTGAGVLAWRGDVWYTCIPKLWKLEDTNGDGVADVRETLHDGYGVRVAFRGHDMHGLVLGPDGRLYFSIGDRGYNVMTQEGTQLVRPDTGAVFRCNPDGSELEVFAYGLRNPQELAFDDYGNLFTGDNNSDSGDKARWVHVVEGGDTGWRMYFQYLEDRGPWNRERIWYPYRADEETTAVQPASTIPPVANLGDGPSGLTYYPGVGLPERYDGHFFMADFRGSSGQSGIRSFAVEPKGATFELVDSDWLIQNVLATDVDFGYDGRMYVSDWVDGWNGTGKGRIYKFAWPEHASSEVVEQIGQRMAAGFDDLGVEQLFKLLFHADRRVRLEAQFALVRKESVGTFGAAVNATDAVDDSRLAELGRIHSVWGLGQLARSSGVVSVEAARSLVTLLNDDSAEIRAQAAGCLGEVLANDEWLLTAAIDTLTELVVEGSPREQYFAAVALGKAGDTEAIEPLLGLLAANNDADPVLRHAASLALARIGDRDALLEAADDPSRSVRLGVVLAMRQLRMPEIAMFLQDGDAAIVEEAARAIHDLPIEEALPELAGMIEQPGMSDLLTRRVLNANFRLGGAEGAEAVATVAADDRQPEHLRVEAVTELLNWAEPPVLDRVTNEYRPIGKRSADEAREAVRGVLASVLSGSDKLRAEGIKLASTYGITEVGPELRRLVEADDNPGPVRAEALAALGALGDDQLSQIVQTSLEDEHAAVRIEARRLLAKEDPQAGVTALQQALSEGTTDERQAAIDTLAALDHEAASGVLLDWMDRLLAGDVPAAIQLDLLEAARQQESEPFEKRLSSFAASRDTSTPVSAYSECLEGGDAERGQAIFFGNAAASCRRCHKVQGSGGDVGPNLSAIGKEKEARYLLESIVDPSAKIAKGFETAVFLLDSGRVVTGIVRGEDDENYRLVSGTGEVLLVPKDEVDDRAVGKSGMPADLVKQLSRRDIRDLVAYLSTLKTPDTTSGAHGEGGEHGE
ncbi:Quinoprotein glucose dehydrogenase B precursor [Maioricimonas rarisocia]|uniref:Quinoprotein glucose dehydrogenase B n=1 Tax=Maioricimonas rarisocia TaxID=2528026 RepID=A0A517Z8P1_9PLAN|nr:PVC-type heme-binding CxxCH protein [Maioricimonas rarisocia]QDU38833.1 Quinoprotein glucose dehydrogenase B precursor [Maioricimonas rarisocia]